ncbi:arsenic-transporting ATPase [Halobacteriales archaeon QH_2_65_14]|nr:MAG: arsenic-transporting ATPase [Halobacteriales archaeon QH_2_65_14]
MEIDVEPVEDLEAIDEETLPSSVDAAEYVLYGGKGGVGKTTMAAATALASAAEGTKTLVVSTDPAHSLSDTLETDVPEEPAPLREDIPLYGAEIDPETALSEGPLGMDGANPLAGMLGEDVADPLAGSMPGADEAAAIRLLLAYLDDPRFDRVVVDTAPTGHTLRLLELPEMLDSMVGKLLTFREHMSGMLDMFGDDPDEEGLDSLHEFSDRIEHLRTLLRDPALTDFRVVMVPEELSVLESERLLERLDAFDIPVGTVVVNRVMQEPTEVADLDPDWFVSPNHTDCEFCARRWEVQQRALKRSQDVFRGHDVRRVPLFAEEVRGEKLLRVVAACLAD